MLVYGGDDDWFLPSLDECNLMISTLYGKRLGGFKGGWYWTSSEADYDPKQIQRFIDSRQQLYHYDQGGTGYVHAIRAFSHGSGWGRMMGALL
jgi:hypothetical protein